MSNELCRAYRTGARLVEEASKQTSQQVAAYGIHVRPLEPPLPRSYKYCWKCIFLLAIRERE
eukprot:6202173-Pleurochrysis_carterae.AAC.2